MGTWEFPLVLFTVFGQWAIGLTLAITLVEYMFGSSLNEAALKKLRMGGIAVLPLVGLGMIFSVFHLGQPLSAIRAISNFGTAKLSMEILAFVIVGVLALIYSYMWWKTPSNASKKLVGLAVSVVGLIAIIISSQVYTLPARLAWNSWQTTAAFVLTALLLGSVSVAFLLSKTEGEAGEKVRKTLGIFVGVSVVLVGLVLGSFAQTYGASAEQSAAVAATFGSSFFVVRLVIGILLPMVFAGHFIGNQKSSSTFAALALVGVVLGELSGRILFYSSVMGQYPWF
ncbi:dimethyl sulfoxide reductase anchor subunit family protein [Desulfitobacterium hafniense]|uniref:dimethyl sulfoxide reductase anchor subunit family protein n=1 Tax=Desulfitobacterium hafniense TaxID=49338 RepID=UPI00036933C5|nr:DmsC/YnfH family molybdoenzyme membrane anchor subunit [Desulfitobacterium hafniense]